MADRIIVGTRKGTFLAKRKNGAFTVDLAGHPGVGVNYAARDPESGTLWAALGHGHWGAKLSRSNDDGKTWSDATQIKYPEGARYLDGFDPETGEEAATPKYKDARLLKLWVIAFGPGGKMWVGTIPGGLFESNDGGESFELNRPLWNHPSRGGNLFDGPGDQGGKTHWFGTPASEGGEFAPGIHSIVPDPTNPERLLIAISTAGVLETLDGGRTWRGRNKGLLNDYLPEKEAEWGHDPHFVTLCPSAPNHVWQQNHCGVFHSSDGAATWSRVSQPEVGVHFGFPIVADSRDGQTAWVVPGKSDQERTTIDGKLFVARTEDGGKTWTRLTRGLPEQAYDVVYRHAFDGAGDALAFGSTTGNLFMSLDRGESWEKISSTLPPIYSVRFG